MKITPHQARLILEYVYAARHIARQRDVLAPAQITLWPEKGERGSLRFSVIPCVTGRIEIEIPRNGDTPLILREAELDAIANP